MFYSRGANGAPLSRKEWIISTNAFGHLRGRAVQLTAIAVAAIIAAISIIGTGGAEEYIPRYDAHGCFDYETARGVGVICAGIAMANEPLTEPAQEHLKSTGATYCADGLRYGWGQASDPILAQVYVYATTLPDNHNSHPNSRNAFVDRADVPSANATTVPYRHDLQAGE